MSAMNPLRPAASRLFCVLLPLAVVLMAAGPAGASVPLGDAPKMPELDLEVGKLFQALLPLAFVIMTAGLVGSFSRTSSPSDQLQTVVSLIVIIAVLSQFDAILDQAQGYVDHLVREELNAHPDEVFRQYLDMVAQRGKNQESKGFWEKLFSPAVTIVEGIVTAFLWLVSLLAGFVLYLAYAAQKLLLQAHYGFAPIFFSFLAVRSLRSIGVQFLLHTGGLLLWPLGWGFCSLVTQKLIASAADQSFFIVDAPEGSVIYAIRNLIFGFLVALWVLGSTAAAPVVIYKWLTTGANLGGIVTSTLRR